MRTTPQSCAVCVDCTLQAIVSMDPDCIYACVCVTIIEYIGGAHNIRFGTCGFQNLQVPSSWQRFPPGPLKTTGPEGFLKPAKASEAYANAHELCRPQNVHFGQKPCYFQLKTRSSSFWPAETSGNNIEVLIFF